MAAKIVNAREVRSYILANPDKFDAEVVERVSTAKRGRLAADVVEAYRKAHRGKKVYGVGTPDKVLRVTGPRGRVKEIAYDEARALVGVAGKRGRISKADQERIAEVLFA